MQVPNAAVPVTERRSHAWIFRGLAAASVLMLPLLQYATPYPVLAQLFLVLALVFALLSGSARWVWGVAGAELALLLLDWFGARPAATVAAYQAELTQRIGSGLAVLLIAGLAWWLLQRRRRGSRLPTQATLATLATQGMGADGRLLQVASETGRVGGWSVELADRRISWSPETARIHGMPPGFSPTFDDAVGFYAPEYRGQIAGLFDMCAKEGVDFDGEFLIKARDGSPVWVRSIGHAVRDEAGQIVAVQGAIQDISLRKRVDERLLRLNRVYALLSKINRTMIESRDRQQLFESACRIAVESGGLRACWVGLLEGAHGHVRPAAKAGNIDGYLESIRVSSLPVTEGLGPFGRAVRENQPVICNDIARDPSFAPWRESALAQGYRSVAVFPLRAKGTVIGAVVFYAESADFFDSEEQRLFSDLADDICFCCETIAREEALRDSEARFRAVFEQAPLAISIMSPDKRFLRLNTRFCDMVGYTEHELLAHGDCVELTHPDDRERDAQAVSMLRDGQPSASLDKRYLHRNGQVVWARLTVSLLQSEPGLEPRFLGMALDITAEKAVEERLAHNQAMVRMASEVSRLAAWEILLPDGRVIASDALCRLAELRPGRLSWTRKALALVDPADRADVKRVFSACAHDGVAFDLEVRCRTGSGRPVWMRLIGEAVADGQGRIVRLQGACQDVTERKLAEQALVASLQRFQQLADSMPLIVWTADADGSVDFCTHALETYTGKAEVDLLHGGSYPTVHPDDREHAVAEWARCRRVVEPYVTELRLRRHDGAYRWHLVRAVPTHDSGGKVAKWYGSATDIDDQKRLEQESRRLAARLGNTLESITDPFLTLDRQWRIVYANQPAAHLLQAERDSLIGTVIWDQLPLRPGSVFRGECERALREGVAVGFVEGHAPTRMLLDVHAYPTDEGLAVYLRDITERRQAESQLRLLETAVSRLNDVVLITEAEPFSQPGPRIVFVNDAFERLTGYTRDEVIGKTPRLLQGPGTQRSELDRIQAALVQWKPVRAELLNYTKSGREIWVELDIVPIADSTGWYTHWVAVQRDITERHMLEEQLRQSQRLESIGQLTGGVAHDFNNLLTVIMGNAELLTDALAHDKSLGSLAAIIGNAAQRGAELTQRMLAFARRQPLVPKVVDVNQLVAGMDGLLRRTLGEQLELEVTRGVGLWQALVDPSQLENALLNLCINSRDAMPQGGRLTIETGNTHIDQAYADRQLEVQAGQYVLVAVSDTGAGIDAAVLGKVFEPFFTTKEKGKGTGLGLSMVYGFVKQSRGHISIYSEPGEGTTIKMYLPRSVLQGQPLEVPLKARVETGSGTILLVEDDDLVRRYAVGQLTSLGYRVIEAADGPGAMQMLQQPDAAHIDLLFTDVVMPGGMGGRALAAAARKLHPRLRVLFTSGYAENAIVHHGRLDPGVQLLSKPYRRAELARRVRETIAADPVP